MPDRDARQFAVELARIAQDGKAEEVVLLDLRSVSSLADFVVVGTGTSDRQIRAVAEQVIEYGHKVGDKPFGVEGYENAAWVLVDFVDVVFHIFGRTYRNYYDLELLWGDAPRLDWARSESA